MKSCLEEPEEHSDSQTSDPGALAISQRHSLLPSMQLIGEASVDSTHGIVRKEELQIDHFINSQDDYISPRFHRLSFHKLPHRALERNGKCIGSPLKTPTVQWDNKIQTHKKFKQKYKEIAGELGPRYVAQKRGRIKENLNGQRNLQVESIELDTYRERWFRKCRENQVQILL